MFFLLRLILTNQVLYTSLVHGCLLANDVNRAWDTFDHMRQREAIEPDEVAFTLMINACAKVSFLHPDIRQP